MTTANTNLVTTAFDTLIARIREAKSPECVVQIDPANATRQPADVADYLTLSVKPDSQHGHALHFNLHLTRSTQTPNTAPRLLTLGRWYICPAPVPGLHSRNAPAVTAALTERRDRLMAVVGDAVAAYVADQTQAD